MLKYFSNSLLKSCCPNMEFVYSSQSFCLVKNNSRSIQAYTSPFLCIADSGYVWRYLCPAFIHALSHLGFS